MSRTARLEWAKRVERWKDSGLSAREFAEQMGLKASTLTYWSWKLKSESTNAGSAVDSARGSEPGRRRRRRRGKAAPRFVELAAGAIATPAMALELVLSRGISLRVPTDFDEATLIRVVRAVEAAQ